MVLGFESLLPSKSNSAYPCGALDLYFVGSGIRTKGGSGIFSEPKVRKAQSEGRAVRFPAPSEQNPNFSPQKRHEGFGALFVFRILCRKKFEHVPLFDADAANENKRRDAEDGEPEPAS